jgi:hypothetical protein
MRGHMHLFNSAMADAYDRSAGLPVFPDSVISPCSCAHGTCGDLTATTPMVSGGLPLTMLTLNRLLPAQIATFVIPVTALINHQGNNRFGRVNF